MSDATLLDARIEAAAQRAGDANALVQTDGERTGYAELWDHAEAIAGWLAHRGVGRGDRVGVWLPKDKTAVASILGILRAGAAYVPIDPASPPARAREILTDCAVAAIVRHPEVAAPCADLAAIQLEAPGPNWSAALSRAMPAPDRDGRSTDDLAYVLYTSGSTGKPKGVMLTHANADTFVQWACDAFQPGAGDRASSHAPFHFDLSIFDLYANLSGGAELHLIDDATAKNPRALGELVEQRELTVWYSTPSVLSLLASFGGLAQRDTSRLRTVLFAGEVFPLKHLRKLAGLVPTADLHNLYGPTETNVCTAAAVPRPIAADRTDPIAIGPACAGYRAAVLDGPGGAHVPDGEPGLLHVAGPALFQGYWGAPRLTAERVFLLGEPGGAPERWYDTGDVVRLDASEGFQYLGRRDRMVKRRGHRVELAEVERALHTHDRILAAAVVALPDPDSGVLLRAHLVVDGKPPSILELKTFCASALPASMVPDRFAFEEALPTTSTDKVDYRRLSAQD